MRAFRIPTALLVVASLAVFGCDQAPATSPDVDVLSPLFNSNGPPPCGIPGEPSCPPMFDSDGDGVLDGADMCVATFIPESAPAVRLGTNRWALIDIDFVFDTKSPETGRGPARSYTTTDTGGCSCEQIIDELGLGQGHLKFGCSISAMDDWVAFVRD